MAIDERARHQLYLKLEGVLGPDEASTLMEHLPPVGWADVATKHDLLELEQRVDLRFEARLQAALNTQTKTLITLNVGMLVGVAGIAFGLAPLL